MEPAIYAGSLRHCRYGPVRHEFRYPLFMAFLDVDRLREAMAISPFCSYNRWNWASFDERDHLGDPARPLRARLVADAAASGVRLPDGPIFLLTHLRYLGYVFNPVSFFYCYGHGTEPEVVLAEVNNTYGGSHRYWLSRSNARPALRGLHFEAAKRLYVSPFMPSNLDYRFTFTPPGADLVAHMTVVEGRQPIFDATLRLERRAWTAGVLHRTLARHPVMTAKVMAAIHWQALRLYLKRVPVVPRATPDGVLDPPRRPES